MSELTAVDILIAARKKISKQEDWGKGRRHFDRPTGTCCVAEAIEESTTFMLPERKRAFRAFYNAAGLDNGWGVITDWNDDPERKHYEVLAAFDLAIATLSPS